MNPAQMFLSVEDLRGLTRRKHKSMIVEFLQKEGIPHFLGADGYPVVLRNVVEQLLRGEVRRSKKTGRLDLPPTAEEMTRWQQVTRLFEYDKLLREQKVRDEIEKRERLAKKQRDLERKQQERDILAKARQLAKQKRDELRQRGKELSRQAYGRDKSDK